MQAAAFEHVLQNDTLFQTDSVSEEETAKQKRNSESKGAEREQDGAEMEYLLSRNRRFGKKRKKRRK